MNTTKKVEAVFASPQTHWVGDGFPVSSVFSPQTVQNALSPYILFDYAGPATFEPAAAPRGVDSHPHRGFETVTVVFQGELEHRDTAGNSGSIGKGDVQWMTAASGVLHEEKHSRKFTREGGTLEMAQLWVNLPASDKMSPPRYQTLLSKDIPCIELPDNAGAVRIIAGDLDSAKGAARTVTPVILWDVRLRAGSNVKLPIPAGFSAAVFVRAGSVHIAGTHDAGARELAILSNNGGSVDLAARENTELLLLGGQPINEPVAAYGPFVMNTPEEIHQAVADVRTGRFGTL
jgi:redox-sensitive bicupin YhaK (pirin superfamily)